jgi:hypothetical protein
MNAHDMGINFATSSRTSTSLLNILAITFVSGNIIAINASCMIQTRRYEVCALRRASFGLASPMSCPTLIDADMDTANGKLR